MVFTEFSSSDDVFRELQDIVCNVNFTDIPIIIAFCFIFIFIHFTLLSHGNLMISTLLFIVSIACLYTTPIVETYFSVYWKTLLFSENYFEQYDLFIVIIWTIPFMFNIVANIFYLIIDISHAMIVKKQFKSIIVHNTADNPKPN